MRTHDPLLCLALETWDALVGELAVRAALVFSLAPPCACEPSGWARLLLLICYAVSVSNRFCGFRTGHYDAGGRVLRYSRVGGSHG